jgi:hypothetical protein
MHVWYGFNANLFVRCQAKRGEDDQTAYGSLSLIFFKNDDTRFSWRWKMVMTIFQR